MIKFIDILQEEPFKEFKRFYEKAIRLNQPNADAMLIASFSKIKDEVDARFVNLKSVEKNKFIFYTSYDSPKSLQFNSHAQVSIVFFWSSINIQARMKCNIEKLTDLKSDLHFFSRSKEKNASVISSNQSKSIDSYESVVRKYKEALKEINEDYKRPDNWGGFECIPYYFEFWEGHPSRINKRISYDLEGNTWAKSFLEP